MRRLFVAAAGIVFALACAPPAPAACDAPEHRAFDFWIGEWDVYNAEGKLAGTNRVERGHDGCVIHERYRSVRDYRGESLNVYDARRKVWHQTWVDNGGLLLLLEGGIENGRMVLQGEGSTRDGKPVTHRITWTPNEDETVRQHWESSADGANWSTVFDGLYRRR